MSWRSGPVIRAGAVLASLLALACGATGSDQQSASATPPPPAATPPALANGIDVSGHSGPVEWPTVVQGGHTFAFLKATEGLDFKDAAFDANWAATKRAGITRGAYHFYVTEDDPTEQARWFTSQVTLAPGDLVPVVDLELVGRGTIPTEIVGHVKTFLGEIERHYGVKPIIYTAVNFWDKNIGAGFGEYPLWVAEYGVDTPRIPAGWAIWHLWQWKGDAEVPGVAKTADLSRVNSSGADLSALIVR